MCIYNMFEVILTFSNKAIGCFVKAWTWRTRCLYVEKLCIEKSLRFSNKKCNQVF